MGRCVGRGKKRRRKKEEEKKSLFSNEKEKKYNGHFEKQGQPQGKLLNSLENFNSI